MESRGSVFQAKGIASVKVLRWEHAWNVQGTAPHYNK